MVGISGSGKTTLTKLLLRFADVNDGAILVDGQNINAITQNSLRENIAYVPQETTLFHRSIAENIAYAKPDATQAEIKRAAKLANASDFIEQMPEGYETLVGERGVKLSGGQRQRIGIARALAVEPDILLMDESTSALDPISTGKIEELAVELKKKYTVIMVTHNMQQAARISDKTGFFLLRDLIEYDTTDNIFSNPKKTKTEEYITGRFG